MTRTSKQVATEGSGEGQAVSKTLISISFHKSKPADQPLIQAANQFLGLPDNEGFTGTSLLRKFFKGCLDLVNAGQLRLNNGQPMIPNGGQS